MESSNPMILWQQVHSNFIQYFDCIALVVTTGIHYPERGSGCYFDILFVCSDEQQIHRIQYMPYKNLVQEQHIVLEQARFNCIYR